MPINGKPHSVFAGDRFGRLTVVGFSHNDKRFRRHYSVRCDCGRTKTVQGTLLRSGNTRSCGCLARQVAKSARLPGDHGAITAIVLQYMRHAADRGIEWHLSRDDVSSLVRQPCVYCGNPAGNIKRTKNLPEGFPHNGIDRLDSSKSYTLANVASCCGLCNRAKRDMSRNQFLAWVQQIANYQASMAAQWAGQEALV